MEDFTAENAESGLEKSRQFYGRQVKPCSRKC